MSVRQNFRLGEMSINTDGDKMTIVIYRNASDIDNIGNKIYEFILKGQVSGDE